MDETTTIEAASFMHLPVMLLWAQTCATQLHGMLHAGLGGLGVLRKLKCWSALKRLLSHPFPDFGCHA
jgi:hypothetical protein